MKKPKLTVDKKTGSAFLRLRPGKPKRSFSVWEGGFTVICDFDARNQLLAIEMLGLDIKLTPGS